MSRVLIVASLATLPYFLTLDGDFVFDDSEAIVKNPDVTSESWTNPFYSDFWGTEITSNLSHKSYRPLTILSFKLNYWLNRKTLSAFHFKAANLICHIISCLLLWSVFDVVIQQSVKRKPVTQKKNNEKEKDKRKKWWRDTAYLSTILFCVHPVHAEAVAGIVGRADQMAAITFFLAFLCYKKATSHKFWLLYLLLTVVLSGISMLCKENGITILGFCLVYELVISIRIKNQTGNKVVNKSFDIIVNKRTVFRTIIISTAIICLLYVRWRVMGSMRPEFKPTENPAAFADSLFSKIATYNYIYFINLLIMVWPQWLCYDWSMGCLPIIETYTDKRIIFILIMYLYGFLVIRKIFKKKAQPSFCRKVILACALIVIPFLPAANILYPVGFVIAERILYIPSAGYCLLVMIGFRKLLHRKSLGGCKVGVLMFLLLVMVFSVRCWQRAIEWHNEYYLFVSGLSVCPLNAKVHYNVAKVADANHQVTWAMSEYKEAIRLYPEYYQAMNNLANILKNQKQYSEAEYFLRIAVKYKKDFPAAWMNLGIVLANTGRFVESEQAYRTAISYRRKYPDCYYNLGNLYLEMNRTDNAVENWQQAINMNPKHVLAWTNLMALMDNTGHLDRALKLIPNVITELPDAPSINFAIANMYGKLNRYGEAETLFKKAIRLFDKDVQAIHYANLGVLYHRWNKYALAEEMYINALKIDPTFKTARKNLDSLRKIK